MPEVSVLIPAYRAATTLGMTLEHLARQTHSNFETILVESGPGKLGETEVRARLPQVKYLSFRERVFPQEALNLALAEAHEDRLALTDADAYPASDWLERLMAAMDERGPIVFGAVDCYGTGWLEEGAHLCKFDKWLPGGPPRLLGEGPTINMGIDRAVFDDIGPFADPSFHGDTEFCWRLRREGYSLWFAPDAIVSHHHLHSFGDLVAERFYRGRGFVEVERQWVKRGRIRSLVRFAVSLLPLRLVNQLFRVRRNAVRAGMEGSLWRSLPVVVSVLYAWLVGEALGHLEGAKGNRGSSS